MKLSKLSLINFRNHAEFHRGFEDLVVISGPNGAGKTNLLEAISYLSGLRSYRTGRDAELIAWQEPFAQLQGIINSQKKDTKLKVQLQKDQSKQAWLDEASQPPSRIIGTLQAISFSPEEIELVGGPPRARRRSLDRILCQSNQSYTKALLGYQKVLRLRNALLNQIAVGRSEANELGFWDEALAARAAPVIELRDQFLDRFQKVFRAAYRALSSQDELVIAYHPSSRADKLLKALERSHAFDTAMRSTQVGPHRDDWSFQLNGKPAASTGSRGEARSAVMAYILGQADYLTEISGERPLLLLDDIFSELDVKRRRALVHLLKNQQTIIATAWPSDLPKLVLKSSQRIVLRKNQRSKIKSQSGGVASRHIDKS